MERRFSRATACLMLALAGLVVVPSVMPAAQVALRWQDNSSNENGFVVERALAGLVWQEVATTGPNITQHSDTTVLPDILYSYRVSAFNAAGRSAYSNVATARVLAQTTLPPTISTIGDQNILVGNSSGLLSFTVSDPDTAVGSLTVTCTTSNTALVPLSGVQLTGTGTSRAVRVTPLAGQTGTTTITILVSDGTTTVAESFRVDVLSAGTVPVFTQAPAGGTFGAGQVMTLRAQATGSGAVSYQWFFEGVAIPGATSADYALPSLQRFHAGVYQVQATSGGFSSMSPAVTVDVAPPVSAGSRVLNLSTRSRCGTGSAVMIPGLSVQGTGLKRLLIRAIGPTLGLAPFGVAGVLPNPQLQLKHMTGGGAIDLVQNQDWGTAPNVAQIRSTAAQLFAFGLADQSRDAAILTDLSSGEYTIWVNDEAGASGVALVEVYDADPSAAAGFLSNYSNRGRVGAGADVMITGFVVSPEGPLTLLLRAVGPGLAANPFNVPGTLADPVMDVYGPGIDGAQTLLFSNNDWSAGPDSSFTEQIANQLHAFPLAPDSRDAALVVTLAPGVYTAIARGAGSAVGVALTELYVVP